MCIGCCDCCVRCVGCACERSALWRVLCMRCVVWVAYVACLSLREVVVGVLFVVLCCVVCDVLFVGCLLFVASCVLFAVRVCSLFVVCCSLLIVVCL